MYIRRNTDVVNTNLGVALSMKLVIFPLLNKRSKTAIERVRKKFGHPYYYKPKQILINRLMQELSMSEDEVLEQLRKEREYLTREFRY